MVVYYRSSNRLTLHALLHCPNHFSHHFWKCLNMGQEQWNPKSAKSFRWEWARASGSWLDLACKAHPHAHPSRHSLPQEGTCCSRFSVLLSDISQFSIVCSKFRGTGNSIPTPWFYHLSYHLTTKPGDKRAIWHVLHQRPQNQEAGETSKIYWWSAWDEHLSLLAATLPSVLPSHKNFQRLLCFQALNGPQQFGPTPKSNSMLYQSTELL